MDTDGKEPRCRTMKQAPALNVAFSQVPQVHHEQDEVTDCNPMHADYVIWYEYSYSQTLAFTESFASCIDGEMVKWYM